MQFSMRPIEETIEDIAKQAQLNKGKNFTSCFLQDGDALVLKTDYLLRILDALNRYFPNLQYITDAQQNKLGQDHTGLFCHATAFHHRVSLKALVNEFQYLIATISVSMPLESSRNRS